MQAEKSKNKRRWSIRVLEVLIVVAAVALTVNLFLPDTSPTSHVIVEEAEPIVAIPAADNGITAQELYDEANRLMQAADYEEALALVNLAIELSDNGELDYYWAQAWLLGEVGEHEAGIDTYHFLLEQTQLERSVAYAYAGLCFNYGSLSDFDAASEYCGLAGEYSSHAQFSSDSMCYIHGFTGQYEQAIEECNSWIENSDHTAYAYNNRSRAYLMLGDYEQAILDATQSIALNTDRPEMPYTNRGLAKIALGNYGSGYADLMVAYGADHTYPDIYLGLARYHYLTGSRDDARANYCRHLSIAWVTPPTSDLERIETLGGCG